MRGKGIKLTGWHLFWLYSTTSLLFVSGALWVLLHHKVFGTAKGALGGVHPMEPWLLKIHGVVAMLFLVIFGTLIPIHVRHGWLSKLNRPSGVAIIAWHVFLIVTACGLYYLSNDDLRSLSSVVHIFLGFTLPLILTIHVIFGKQAGQWRIVDIRRHKDSF